LGVGRGCEGIGDAGQHASSLLDRERHGIGEGSMVLRAPPRWRPVPAAPFSVQTSSDSRACAFATRLIRQRAPRAGAARSTRALSPSSGGLPGTNSPAHHFVVVDTKFRCVLLCYSSRRFVLSAFYLSYIFHLFRSFLLPYIRILLEL
jgi:hypothetical protein